MSYSIKPLYIYSLIYTHRLDKRVLRISGWAVASLKVRYWQPLVYSCAYSPRLATALCQSQHHIRSGIELPPLSPAV